MRVRASRERGFLTAQAAVLWATLLVVYAAGACPTIYVGDSGELVAAVHTLGIPHPTGYPLYVLLGKLWTILIPFGSIAYRMSLFNAACAAAAAALLYAVGRRLELPAPAALTGALLLAFSPSYWHEANIQRVYALNALFVVGATAAFVGWNERRTLGRLALVFFICGLGATNHTVMALVGAAAAVAVLAAEPRAFLKGRSLAACGVAAWAGLLPYAYLPVRSRMEPPLDWGNPETLKGFLDVVLRRGFWVRRYIEGPPDLIPIAANYARGLGVELLWVGTALAALGLYAAWRGGRRWLAVFASAVMVLNFAALAAHGSRSDIFLWHRYYIPSYVMAALLAAVGTQYAARRAGGAVAWLALLIPLALFVTGWRQADRSRYLVAESYSRAILAALPPGAHLIASDDNILFVLIYLQFVENLRPDVDLILQGVGAADLPPLRFDPDREGLFFTHHPNWNVPGLEIVPRGLVFQAWRAGRPLPPPLLAPAELEGENDPAVPKDDLTRNLIGEFHYMKGVTLEARDWVAARWQFRRAAEAAPDNDVIFYNLGLIYRRNGLVDDALEAFERSHHNNPRHLASQSRPRPADRVAEMRAERERLRAIERALAGDPALASVADPVARHLRLAELLEARGETRAARGHRLQALEIKAGLRGR